tara:strand:- start:2303 stop:2572 length:270 start_codon:yes stop_codon:yes gene_type:complete
MPNMNELHTYSVGFTAIYTEEGQQVSARGKRLILADSYKNAMQALDYLKEHLIETLGLPNQAKINFGKPESVNTVLIPFYKLNPIKSSK